MAHPLVWVRQWAYTATVAALTCTWYKRRLPTCGEGASQLLPTANGDGDGASYAPLGDESPASPRVLAQVRAAGAARKRWNGCGC